MARFIVVHSSPENSSQDQMIAFARQVAASLPAGTEWRNSWYSGEADKLFCEWEAPSKEAIQAALEAAGWVVQDAEEMNIAYVDEDVVGSVKART